MITILVEKNEIFLQRKIHINLDKVYVFNVQDKDYEYYKQDSIGTFVNYKCFRI